MAQLSTPCLYRETRLNLDPAFRGSTISLTLPIEGTLTSNRAGTRSIIHQDHADLDEAQFSKFHLATDGSIFFRHADAYPRAFLWRVLDNRRVLELQSVDLSQKARRQDILEAQLTIRLRFPEALRQHCVAFAESSETDVLNVFAITGKKLWTLSMKPEFWVSERATDNDVETWCKTYNSSTLAGRMPFRLTAINAEFLVIGLDNGAVMQMRRKPGDSGSFWVDNVWNERRFGALRGIVSWKGPTVRFGNEDYSSTTAIAAAESPNKKHLVTVTLDHYLKFWDVESGVVLTQKDLIEEQDRDNKSHVPTMNPAQTQVLQLLDLDGGADGLTYYLVTFSPLHRQFRFWAVSDPNVTDYGIKELSAGNNLTPPFDDITDATLWTLEEFYLDVSKGLSDAVLWTRVRVASNSLTFRLAFSLEDPDTELKKAWANNWTLVDTGFIAVETTKRPQDQPMEPDLQNPRMHEPSASEQWLKYLCHPGRFTIPTLETALYVYRRGSGQSLSKKRSRGEDTSQRPSLKERLCRAVASKVSMQRNMDEAPDYNQYEIDLTAQWQIFHGLVRDLQKRRSEALSLAFDATSDLPWLVRADIVAPLRKCSELELLALNGDLLTSSEALETTAPLSRALQDRGSIKVAKLLKAASTFASTFGQLFIQELRRAVNIETLKDPSAAINDRIREFDAQCGLGNQVTDEDFALLVDSLQDLGGLKHIDTSLFEAVFKRLDERQRGVEQKIQLTRYGARTITRGAQEVLELANATLLELLVLLVFIIGELESNGEQPRFNKASLFDSFVSRLRDHGLLLWLASTSYAEGPTQTEGTSEMMEVSSSKQPGNPISELTVLESVFIGDWATMKFPRNDAKSHLSLSSLVTYWCRAWVYRATLSQSFDSVASHVMGKLLVSGNTELALQFSAYVPNTPWGLYQKARLRLAMGELSEAGLSFTKCAFGLSTTLFDVEQWDYAGLLDPEEQSYFSSGLCRFYQHVVALFEKVGAYTRVAEYAKLALVALAAEPQSEDSKVITTELLSRLFNASIRTSKFEDAYSALSRYPNPAVRRASLRTFLAALATSSPPSTYLLTRLPFTAIAADVDEVLSSLCVSPPSQFLSLTGGTPPCLSRHSTPPSNYHNLLYAFRISRNDFRGAAAILYDRLQHLKKSAGHSTRDDEARSHTYLLLINLLSCVRKDQAWIVAKNPLASPSARFTNPTSMSLVDSNAPGMKSLSGVGAKDSGPQAGGVGNWMSGALFSSTNSASQMDKSTSKSTSGHAFEDPFSAAAKEQRRSGGVDKAVVTLEDVRREYQEELDRLAAIDGGKFAFSAAREEDGEEAFWRAAEGVDEVMVDV